MSAYRASTLPPMGSPAATPSAFQTRLRQNDEAHILHPITTKPRAAFQTRSWLTPAACLESAINLVRSTMQ